MIIKDEEEYWVKPVSYQVRAKHFIMVEIVKYGEFIRLFLSDRMYNVWYIDI